MRYCCIGRNDEDKTELHLLPAQMTKHCQKSLSENLDSVGSRPPGTANWGIQRGMFREDKESNIRTTAHKRFAENRVVVGVAG
jgi:uncharacterized protein YjlB